MKQLDLSASPLDAAIRARPPEPIRPVWIYSETRRKWCVLREARPAYAAVALCLAPLPSGPLNVRTTRPGNTCSACETELAAGTPGAAVAVEAPPDAVSEDAITGPRVITEDLRPAHRRVDPTSAWDGEGGAIVHLEDAEASPP